MEAKEKENIPTKNLKPPNEATRFSQTKLGLKLSHSKAPIRLTTIMVTYGPACDSIQILEEMIASGASNFRINHTENSYDYYAEAIKKIQKAAENFSKKIGFEYPVAIALDIKGPEIYTGIPKAGIGSKILLKSNEKVKLTIKPIYSEECTSDIIYIDYPPVIDYVKPGDRIYVDGGIITLIVTEKHKTNIICTIEYGGILGAKKILNIPGISLPFPNLTEKDRADILFGVEQGVDMVLASFVCNVEKVREIRNLLGIKGQNIQILSKIENQEGLDNLEEIMKASDGIVIARGDLGIEITPEEVFLAQKYITKRCNQRGKPVIVVSQLLESMIKLPRPTRAEVSDIANSVVDGIDCLMLSPETAFGIYPAKSVRTISSTCIQAELTLLEKDYSFEIAESQTHTDTASAVAIASVEAANKSKSTAIVCLTTSGRTAQLLAKFKPKCPILAITRYSQVARQLRIYRGIKAVLYTEPQISDWIHDVDRRVTYGLKIAQKFKCIKSGDLVIVVTGWKPGSGFTNTMRIMYAFFDED